MSSGSPAPTSAVLVYGGLVPGASYTATYPFGSRKAALVVGEIDRARRGRQSLQRDGQDLRPRIDDDEPGHGSEPVGWRTAADPDGDREPRVTIGTAPLVNGVATLTISTLFPGAHSLTAVYSGSLDFLTSTSAAVIQNVAGNASTTTLTSSANPIKRRQAVTFTATVSPVAPATATPTGTVTFRDGTTVLATVTLVGGRASFTTTRLEAGTHPITATYSGSITFGGSASAVLNQVITP